MTRTNQLDLLIATGNYGKAEEIRVMLGDLDINFRTLSDFPDIRPVEESGDTYEHNAARKAHGYAQQTGLWALADDSGFEVMALNRAPGVFSARYAGEGASDKERVALLLRELNSSSEKDRKGRFVCVTALADPKSAIANIEYGACDGLVIDTPRGGLGFGYDPIFVPDGFDMTFAELPSSIKNVISHRAKALQGMRSFLKSLISTE